MLIKIIISLILWAVFIFAVFQIPYPDTFTKSNSLQLLGFFIPLFLAIVLTINIFLKNIYMSGSISLALICLLILKALDSLNLITVVLLLITVGLLISYFKKRKRSLTNDSKIPKLTRLKKGNLK